MGLERRGRYPAIPPSAFDITCFLAPERAERISRKVGLAERTRFEPKALRSGRQVAFGLLTPIAKPKRDGNRRSVKVAACPRNQTYLVISVRYANAASAGSMPSPQSAPW
jgi:hypothetical protein